MTVSRAIAALEEDMISGKDPQFRDIRELIAEVRRLRAAPVRVYTNARDLAVDFGQSFGAGWFRDNPRVAVVVVPGPETPGAFPASAHDTLAIACFDGRHAPKVYNDRYCQCGAVEFSRYGDQWPVLKPGPE